MSCHHRHKLSFYSLTCCLRPPQPKKIPRIRFTPGMYSSHTSSSSSSSYSSSLTEPSSPQVSCMGRVKKNKPSKTNASSTSSWSSSSNACVKSGGFLERTQRRVGCGGTSKVMDACGVAWVDVKDLDPPLPVVKRAVKDDDSVSLWNRRRGGAALDGLRLPSKKL